MPRLFSVPRLFLFTALFYSLIFASVCYAAESIPSYKSKTDDECIKEKECVWYHFVLATQVNRLGGKFSKHLNIKKWEDPVRIRFANSDRERADAGENYINQIAPFLAKDSTTSTKYNYLIMFTNDIEAEINGEFKGIFDSLVGKGLVLNDYKENDLNKGCYSLAIPHPYERSLYSYFAFIRADNKNFSTCLRKLTYEGFGVSSIAHSKIWDEAKKTDKYSKVELLVLFILQQHAFKSGTNYDRAQKAFDLTYEPAMKYLDQNGAFNILEKRMDQLQKQQKSGLTE